MSWRVTAYVRENSKSKLAARLVLYALSDRANDDGGGAWPAVETIAREERLSRRAVQEALRWLEQHGEIRRTGVHPVHKTVVWQVVIDPQTKGAKSAPVSKSGAQNLRGGGAKSAPKPSLEPPSSLTNVKPTSSTADQEREVFDHWQQVMDKPRALFTEDRRRKVRARLREGYTVEQLKAAVDGCRRSAFHMGRNDRRVRYDDLQLICRSGSHVERFAAEPGGGDRHRLGQTTIDNAAVFNRGGGAA